MVPILVEQFPAALQYQLSLRNSD